MRNIDLFLTHVNSSLSGLRNYYSIKTQFLQSIFLNLSAMGHKKQYLEQENEVKQKFTIIIAVCAFILALAITLYPIISTRYNARHQSQIYVDYQAQLTQTDNTALQTALQAAIAYNTAIQPGVQHRDAFSQDALRRAANDYDDLLNMGDRGIMGYVEIPNICVKLPIYHGTENATLEKGVGHLLGSSLPVGGNSTHTVLTAHSGMASQKMFSDLDTLAIGDVFYLDILGERLAYQVDQIKTVLPHDTTYLSIIDGADLCTLVTCTPFGINTHRLLVRGKRISLEESAQITEVTSGTERSGSTWEREYRKGICIALGSVATALFITVLIRRIQVRTFKKINQKMEVK